MTEKKNIMGLVFRCEDCQKEFRIGNKGVAACYKRAREHAWLNGHLNINPVNPPKGLTYASWDGEIKVVFDGENLDEFEHKVKSLARKHQCEFIPLMELSEETPEYLKTRKEELIKQITPNVYPTAQIYQRQITVEEYICSIAEFFNTEMMDRRMPVKMAPLFAKLGVILDKLGEFEY